MEGSTRSPVAATDRTVLPAARAATRPRLAWVDVAKGASIVLVVLVHVTSRHLVYLDDATQGFRDDWVTIGRWLRPVRMPLFFLLSGLLAASVLARMDRVALRRKIARSFELYFVWMFLQTVLVDRFLRPDVVTNSLRGFLDALIVPAGSLWYLWAMGAYVGVLAAIPRRWRTGALGAFACLWLVVATDLVHLELRHRDLALYLVWFTLGVVAPDAIRALVDRFSGVTMVVAVAAFVVATATLRRYLPVSVPALQVLGVLAGLAVAARVRGPAEAALGILGRHTLAVYVLHVPMLTIWRELLLRVGWDGAAPHEAVLWVYPVVLTTALLAASIGIERAVRRAGAGWLFGDRRPSRAPRPTPS